MVSAAELSAGVKRDFTDQEGLARSVSRSLVLEESVRIIAGALNV